MKDPAIQARAAALLRENSLLHATRALMRAYPSLERCEALAYLEHVPESGLWSKANVNFGWGYKSPEREYDPVPMDD